MNDNNLADELGFDLDRSSKPEPLVINLKTRFQGINAIELIKDSSQMGRRAHNDVVASLNTARRVLYPEANDPPINGREKDIILKHIRDLRRIGDFLESLVQESPDSESEP